MALNIAVGDLLNLRIIVDAPGSVQTLNVLHYRVAAITGTIPALQDALPAIAGALNDHVGAAYAAVMASDCSYMGASATDVFPLPRSTTFYSLEVTPLPGTEAGESLPPQNAVTILKRTARGDRHGLGRLFVTGVPEGNSSDGVIEPALVARYNTLAPLFKDNLVATIGGSTITVAPVLLQGPEDNPVTITPIIAAALSNNIIKVRRSRRPGEAS